MATTPIRLPYDPTGYVGPLRYLEVMLGGKHRPGSGTWAEANELTTIIYDAAFSSGKALKDSHGQIAHYARSFELFDKNDPDRKAELLERLDTIPHLADFHVDIDFAGDLAASQAEAIKLVTHYESLGVPEPLIGIRFSGKKGFDVMVPWQVLGVSPQGAIGLNYLTYKMLAMELVETLHLKGVDIGLYRRNGTIRLENTLHPSGLHKVRVTPDELRGPLDTILELAKKPRRALYSPEAEIELRGEPVLALRSMYLVARAKSDAELLRVRQLDHRPASPEALAELAGSLTPCLTNIAASAPSRGTRNETLFHAAMMLKHTEHDESETRDYALEWLGKGAYSDIGAEGTIRSVFSGPYAGGCRWMRDTGWAMESGCRACPIGQHRFEREARVVPEELPVVVDDARLPSIAEQRENLRRDFADLDPYVLNVIRVPAGVGKSHTALQRAVEIAKAGGRSLFFSKDTLKTTSLAADMVDELREKHQYGGKIQVLYGRNEDNCEDWENAEKVGKKGYSVGKMLCGTCSARSYCDYYGQYERSYEPGIYIAPHAMLPILFDDERRGFSSETMTFKDEDGAVNLGGSLSLIVVDEDALDVLIDRYWVGSFHLENELRQRKRYLKSTDKLTGLSSQTPRSLDRNWLRIVEWMQAAIKIPGPLLPSLISVAKADSANLRSTLLAIDPRNIIDPDMKKNRGHKPFTVKLYSALLREMPRANDGNYTIWATGTGLEVMSMAAVNFPAGVPVAILDAYANEDVYRRYFRAAGVNRLPVFRDYPVREQANVTYVLGANLLKSTFTKATAGGSPALEKIERVMRALRKLTSDGVETYLVAKRDFFASDVWQRWEPQLPNCVADGDAGQLYFWRGRGINAAAGKRVAVLQVPNFHPSAVLAEASVLYADEPRLDDQRVRVEEVVPWAAGAVNAKPYKVDRTVYADPRLNLINERYRLDELVQMALRSRSLTTGAEIIIFADLPDPRLPASRVFTVNELADDTGEARRLVYETLRSAGELNIQNLIDLGVVEGGDSATPLRKLLKAEHPEALRIARLRPIGVDVATREIADG